MPNEKSLAEMVWDDLQTQINDIKARVDTIEKRTERSETTSGHPAMTVATAPLAGQGVKQGDELFMNDGSNLADRTGGDGVPAFYDPDSDSWVRTGFLPTRHTFWHDESLVLTGGALNRVFDAANPMYSIRVLQSPGALNDSFTQSFLLKAGTYDLFMLHEVNTNRGIISWYIDDVLQGTIDTYNAVGSSNNFSSIPVTVTTHGRHVIKGSVEGRNAASAGFQIIMVKYWIQPSAD